MMIIMIVLTIDMCNRSARGESYDMVIKVHDPSTKRGCHYVFWTLDCRSMREVPIITNTVFDVKSGKKFLEKASQTKRITELIWGESFA